MLASYKIDGNKLHVSAMYSEDVVAQCRKWAGTYSKSSGCWVLPVSRLPEVQAEIGENQDDQVEVEVGREDWTGYAQIRVGWHILAGRRGRDYRAEVHADLVAGDIPSCGGSVKNPAVSASSDARFRLWVPRDFATAKDLQIVTEDKAASDDPHADIKAERLLLMSRIAEIDAILAAHVEPTPSRAVLG